MAEGQVAQAVAGLVDDAAAVLRPHFHRTEAHRHAADYLRGLVADVERKNGWQLAEQAGYVHPRGMQRVLDRYAWDADAVRDDLLSYAATELGDPHGILVVDETCFPKQGKHSAGVARQYCGTLGKIANCQVGVFLGYASPKGHVALDRDLYLPEGWCANQERCRKAGIPESVRYRTKPELARLLLERAVAAGIPAAWVTGDEVYGSDGKLRRALEDRGHGYVLAVRGNQAVATWPPYAVPGQTRVAVLAGRLRPEGWQRLSCGEGAQGPRVYDWSWAALRPALREGWVHGLLLRRHPERPEEVAFYLVYAPEGMALDELVRVAGARWRIEDLFKLAKGQVGLDQYEVRSWRGWYRHVTLALLALTVLTVGARKKGGRCARSTFPSRSQRSGGSSFGSSGRPSGPLARSQRGPAGAATIRRSPTSATSIAA
jgi:SRSO17 transposase